MYCMYICRTKCSRRIATTGSILGPVEDEACTILFTKLRGVTIPPRIITSRSHYYLYMIKLLCVVIVVPAVFALIPYLLFFWNEEV